MFRILLQERFVAFIAYSSAVSHLTHHLTDRHGLRLHSLQNTTTHHQHLQGTTVQKDAHQRRLGFRTLYGQASIWPIAAQGVPAPLVLATPHYAHGPVQSRPPLLWFFPAVLEGEGEDGRAWPSEDAEDGCTAPSQGTVATKFSGLGVVESFKHGFFAAAVPFATAAPLLGAAFWCGGRPSLVAHRRTGNTLLCARSADSWTCRCHRSC